MYLQIVLHSSQANIHKKKSSLNIKMENNAFLSKDYISVYLHRFLSNQNIILFEGKDNGEKVNENNIIV